MFRHWIGEDAKEAPQPFEFLIKLGRLQNERRRMIAPPLNDRANIIGLLLVQEAIRAILRDVM